MTTRNGKRQRESLEDELVGAAWESHVDKRPRSDTLNVEDDRREAREAEVSRVRCHCILGCLLIRATVRLTASCLTTEFGSPTTLC